MWVFIDYNNAGTMTRLPLDPNAATLTQHSATNCPDCGVDRARSTADGVWVVGNARTEGTFTATVRVVGAGLTPTDVARHVSTGMCVYAINYPPVAQYTDDGNIKLTGTPPFYLSYSGGGAATVTRDEAKQSVKLENTLVSFTDASLAPGVINCKTPDPQTLESTATVYCADADGVALSLSGSVNGAIYRLWQDGAAAGSITGNGRPMPFPDRRRQGTYTATVEATAQFCAATLTSQVTVTEVALPATPSVPTPASVCEGNALTFVADGGSGSYDWSGDVSGEGNSLTYTGEKGKYSASARSLLRYAGTTCYSAYSELAEAEIAGPGSIGDPSACGCAEGDACNGYCYQVPDGVGTCIACGFRGQLECSDSGWTLNKASDPACVYESRKKIGDMLCCDQRNEDCLRYCKTYYNTDDYENGDWCDCFETSPDC